MSTTNAPAGLALKIVISLLTVITAVIHLSIGVPLFVLNGLGYLGLLVLLYAPFAPLRPIQPIVRWVLVGYTALTVALYFLAGPPFDTLGLLTKAVEVLLIIALVIEARRARSVPAVGAAPSRG
ncbi:hypothetical protein [Brachybacterium sp.]|uniref:hypothetical protein n=1 Tax=Brachybacterium sp. TaxID=1891286 RepID=UPI002ED69FB3